MLNVLYKVKASWEKNFHRFLTLLTSWRLERDLLGRVGGLLRLC